MEDPNLVKRPKPSNASGHIPAQIKEFGKPNSTTNHIDIFAVCPKNVTRSFTNIINMESTSPSTVQIRNPLTWLINLGINKIPRI